MTLLKTATDWARAELLSNGVFLLMGALFLGAGIAIWQMGRTEMARAYVVPMLVAAVLLLILGGGQLYGTWSSLSGYDAAIAEDAQGFLASEFARIDRTIAQYATAVFKVMPLMIATAAVLILILDGPQWRAALITSIVFLSVVMVVDSTANARLHSYRDQLARAAKE